MRFAEHILRDVCQGTVYHALCGLHFRESPLLLPAHRRSRCLHNLAYYRLKLAIHPVSH